jgi:hypothetical protein
MLTEFFSPFYDFARRQLGLKPSIVKQYLEAHATASINGRTVELRDGDAVVVGHVGIGHAAHATKWVNQFNARAHAA